MRRQLIGALAILIVSIVAQGSESSMFVERREITKGEIHGLAIGMDRETALMTAKRLGARHVSAIPCDKFRVDKTNVNELPAFQNLEGIRLATYKGSFEDIYFGGRRVTKIAKSPVGDLTLAVNVGDQVELVRKTVLDVVMARGDVTVSPIISDAANRSISLDADSSAVIAKLESSDCWSFEVPSVKPAGAIYELAFTPKGLQRVRYQRPRIRIE